jgi:substrate import-associated zinc metallohydrolase lipoprotein
MDGDPTFIKTYAPRVFVLSGTRQYKSDGSEVLGTAEGGLKITMYGVNFLNLDNPYVDYTSPFPNRAQDPMDLNHYFFHTLHHEFCHILNQKKNYPEEFQTVSLGHFRSGDWINVRDDIAPAYGFITGYSTSEHREDFAEIYSTYVTHTQEAWDSIVGRAKELVTTPAKYEKESWWEGRSENAAAEIDQKLVIVKNYFKDVWNIDMDKLREIVLRRSDEVTNLDLRNLPVN